MMYDSVSQTTTSLPALASISFEASTLPLRVWTMVTLSTFFGCMPAV